MINSVAAKGGFKGLPDFETKLERLTLLIGPNGTGKTARSHALSLAVLGYVPGMAKTNPQILAMFGNGEKVVVEVRRDGKRLSRGWFRQPSGQVTEKFQIDLKRASKEQYAAALGGLKMFDLGAFQKLSDQAKIDFVFDVFPPGEDFVKLDDAIELKKAERNKLQKDIETLNATCARIHQQRATIDLPSGTLAEIQAQIAEAEAQLRMSRELAERHRLDLAKIEAKKEEQRRQEALQAERAADMEQTHGRALFEEIDKTPVVAPDTWRPVPEVHNAPAPAASDAAASIRLILETMSRTGCSTCAAVLVCRRELKKLQEVA